jgi:hypothetical protein
LKKINICESYLLWDEDPPDDDPEEREPPELEPPE